ncbi:MAG: hypothetical protein J7L82_04460, partial [Staphylothermus sp.]|nr:hypothetical protein [Staphylothermus sp.]
VKNLWSRTLEKNCIIDAVKYQYEWIELLLYCKDQYLSYRINSISGKMEIKRLDRVPLRGKVGRRREFYTLVCYRGLENRVWTKIVKVLNAKMICRKDICIATLAKPGLVLEINIFSGNGETLEKFTINGVMDFKLVASDNLIAVTTRGDRRQGTVTIIVDSSTGSIIEQQTGFGGGAIADMNYVLVFGEHEGKVFTQGYNNDGEEIIPGGEEGLPVLIPYNPFPAMIDDQISMFESKQIVLMGKNELKLYNPEEFLIEYTFIRPPFTKGVLSLNVHKNITSVIARIMDRPVVATYDINGKILWISPTIRNLKYALITSEIVGMAVKENDVWKTKVYRIKGDNLELEQIFAPNVLPIYARKDNITVTDGNVIALYRME